LYEFAFLATGKNLNKILTAMTVVSRNANEALMVPVVGSRRVCVWGESKVGRRECSFIRREDVSTFNLLYKKMFIHVKF
jgi:hypothetical protein